MRGELVEGGAVTPAAPLPGRSGQPVTIGQLVAAKEIVICCGTGGVGKTTTAAAIGSMAALRHGGKVLVMTVDPARRLADALGLSGVGNAETLVPRAAFDAAGVRPRGELWVAMLDTRTSWDQLVRMHAPDPETAAEILRNPLYQNVTGRFVHSHEYISMERLYEAHGSGDYDLIVVDTPPTRYAIDFLDAPGRMAELFSSRLLRWLTIPYRSRLVTLASRPFYQVADRILGSAFLQDVAEFFLLFQSMYSGFVERSEAVSRLLADRRSTFVVVTTLDDVPLAEADRMVGILGERGHHLGALVLNRVLPAYLRDDTPGKVAEEMQARAADLATELAGRLDGGGASDDMAQVLARIGESFSNFQVVARREAELEAELARRPDVLASVPFLGTDVHDLAGVIRVGEHLWS